jgi:hypothetical protein
MNCEIQQAIDAMEEVLKYRRGDGRYNISLHSNPENARLLAETLWHEVESQLIEAINALKKPCR